MENTETIVKVQSQASIPCRIYQISRDGIQLGGSPINGRFPWGNAHGVAKELIRAWARDLVAGHDAAELGAILLQWLGDWSFGKNITEIDPPVDELAPLDTLLNCLGDKSIDRKSCFGQQYDNHDAVMMFHLSNAMIEAIGYCLKKMGAKLRIQWEIEFLPNDTGIYRILLEGGKQHES